MSNEQTCCHVVCWSLFGRPYTVSTAHQCSLVADPEFWNREWNARVGIWGGVLARIFIWNCMQKWCIFVSNCCLVQMHPVNMGERRPLPLNL